MKGFEITKLTEKRNGTIKSIETWVEMHNSTKEMLEIMNTRNANKEDNEYYVVIEIKA